MEAGSSTSSGRLAENLTSTPAAGAGAASWTVMVNRSPARTCAADRVILVRVASTGRGLTVTVAVIVAAPRLAERVTGVLTVTLPAVTETEMPVCPAGTVTVAGTGRMAGAELDSATTVPPAGAGDVSDTVSDSAEPDSTVAGEGVKDAS